MYHEKYVHFILLENKIIAMEFHGLNPSKIYGCGCKET